MNLGYKQHFPFNGQWTNFEHKILAGFPVRYQRDHARTLCANLPEKQRVAYIHLFMDNMEVDPKLHSIREDPQDRWKPGMKIHHSFGVRTKSYRCFAINECISTQRIEIQYLEWWEFQGDYSYLPESSKFYLRVYIDDALLETKDFSKLIELTRNDGFDNVEDFFRWFNKPFKGKIIHWTNLKY